MALRSFWKGYLRLSLVTIAIQLVTAVRSEGVISFHQVDKKSRERIRYQKIAPGRGPVEADDIVKGYEVNPGEYVLFEDEELDALKLETKHTIELTQFVDEDEIDPVFYDRTYYALPDGDVAEEGYRVIRAALADAGKCGIGQLAMRGKEYLVAMRPVGEGLAVSTLHYAGEILPAADAFRDIEHGKPQKDLVDMARHLIDTKSARFDPAAFKNHYSEALRALVRQKIETGKAVAVDEEKEPRAPKVIDFMEALRRSVAQKEGEEPRAREEAPPVRQSERPRSRAASSGRAEQRRAPSRPSRKRSA